MKSLGIRSWRIALVAICFQSTMLCGQIPESHSGRAADHSTALALPHDLILPMHSDASGVPPLVHAGVFEIFVLRPENFHKWPDNTAEATIEQKSPG